MICDTMCMKCGRCNLMYMQIGFVIEGRDDRELPEVRSFHVSLLHLSPSLPPLHPTASLSISPQVLFACVAVNKPQEDQAEYLFDEE